MNPSELTIRRALESGNPVVHGNKATFIWEGEFAPQLISDVHGWDAERKPKPSAKSTSNSPHKPR